MKTEDIIAFAELLLENWHYAAAIAVLYLIASYVVALTTALGKGHGERLSEKPDSRREASAAGAPAPPSDIESAVALATLAPSPPLGIETIDASDWQAVKAFQRKRAVVVVFAFAAAVGLSSFTVSVLSPKDPCQMSQPNRTIQEQITCERLPR